jgi:hypothetical protein
MISVTQPVAGCDRSCIVDRANWAVSARWHPRPDCGADKLVVKVDSFDADGISSVDVSIWAGPVRSGGEAGRARHQREDTMTHYLLSVHSVEGEVREPMTDEEMAQSHKQLAVLEQELKSTGAWVVSGRLHESATATVVRMAGGEVVTTDGPFVESKEHLGGFYIVQAPDLDVALTWASRVTGAIKAPIEVRPFAGFEA